jgi:AcrR family transcriptional regulator
MAERRKKARRRKPAEVRRHDIVEAAMEIIRHHGVASLTTRSLSRAAGVAQPTLFLHFGDKSRVLIALVESIQSRLQDGLKSQNLANLSPLERLKAVIRFHLGFIQKHPGIPRLLFSEELQTGDAKFRDRMQGLVEGYLKFITGLIQAGQAAGELRRDLDPEANACLLVAAVQGLAFRWLLTEGRKFVLADQADIIIGAYIEGWRPR